MGFAPQTTRSAKQQALDVIKVLEKDHGLKRAPMELKVACGGADAAVVAAALRAVDADVTATVSNDSVACVAPPRVYRQLVAAVAAASDGAGAVSVVDRAAAVDKTVSEKTPGGAEKTPPPPDAARPPRPPAVPVVPKKRTPAGPVAPKPRTRAPDAAPRAGRASKATDAGGGPTPET